MAVSITQCYLPPQSVCANANAQDDGQDEDGQDDDKNILYYITLYYTNTTYTILLPY